MRVSYPLKNITSDSAQNYFGSRNQFGFYPISRFNTWHGGIHLEERNTGVLAIADGRIIAYRFASDYITETIDDKEYEYSNGFILVQHDYKSPEGQEMTFYSLYHHLMPKSSIDESASLDIPSIFADKTYKVKEGQLKIKGLNARSAEKFSTIVFVLPKGAIVTLDDDDTPEDHWSRVSMKKTQYKKVIYTDTQNTTHKDIYIATTSSCVTVLSNNQLQVNESNNDYGLRAEKGEHERETPSSNGNILRVIAPDTLLNIDGEPVKGYGKVIYNENPPEKTGHVWMNSLRETTALKEDITLDEITACDIPIKAGMLMGYTGKFAFEKHAGYAATHLEVFTTDDVDAFLGNKEDGKEEQYFTKLPAGTKLKTNLSFTIDLKKNTPLNVLEINGDYARVEIGSLIKTCLRSQLHNYQSHDKSYQILPEHLDNINTLFENLISPTDKLYLNKQLEGEDRSLLYIFPDTGKKYWIKKSYIAQTTINAGCEDETTVDAAAGSNSKTNAAVTKAYAELPIESKTNESTIDKEVTVNLRTFKKAKDNDGKLWYKVICSYFKNNIPELRIGWLKDEGLTKFSAYNWKEFGFKMLDAGSEFIYSVKDLREATETSSFIDEIWGYIDENGDKTFSPQEWRQAFNDRGAAQHFSKFVCKHKNEWAYTASEIKPEVEQLYDIGIDLEEDAEKKQELTDKKQDRLSKLEEKITNLMWWQETAGKPYTDPNPPPQKTEEEIGTEEIQKHCSFPLLKKEEAPLPPPRKFPNSDTVYHFHPIAFVEQMMLVYKKADIDLRPTMVFEAQKGKSDCNVTCKRIMQRMGVIAEGADVDAKAFPLKVNGTRRKESFYQLADENKERTALIFRNDSKAKKAYEYIDSALESGHPILIGVNHTYNYRSSTDYINESTTDHYVIIVGRKYVGGEQRYIFWDVGTRNGATTEWFFVQQEDGKLVAEKTYKPNNKSYTVTQIRRNINENNKVITY